MNEKTTGKGQEKKKTEQQQGRTEPIQPSGPHHGNPATAGPGGTNRNVKSATPENSAGHINPSAPTQSTEQDAHHHQSGDNSGMGAMGYGGSQKPQTASRGIQDAGRSATHSQHGNKKSFHCADAGYRDCHWKVEGAENEILPQIEQHAKDIHRVQMKPEARKQVKHLLKDAA
jgi:predicted small metal-binding protein